MSNLQTAIDAIFSLTKELRTVPGINREDLEVARLRALEQLIGIDLEAFQSVLMLAEPDTEEAELELAHGQIFIVTDKGHQYVSVMATHDGELRRVLIQTDSAEEAVLLARQLRDSLRDDALGSATRN